MSLCGCACCSYRRAWLELLESAGCGLKLLQIADVAFVTSVKPGLVSCNLGSLFVFGFRLKRMLSSKNLNTDSEGN